MKRQGKSRDAVEERMQSASKAFWKDILIYKSKDVPWKVKCQRLVDHVCAVFAFGSENLPWTIQALEKIKGWETKTMSRLFRIKRHKEETWVGYHTRTCNMARKVWIQMGWPFLYEVIAESMWRTVGWAYDERSNAVINTLKKVYRWRSTRWWHSLQTEMMERDSANHTKWKHKWSCTIVETCGIKLLRNGQVQKNG